MLSLTVDDDMQSSTTLNTPRRQKTSYLKRVAAAKREETEAENRVTLKLEDVKVGLFSAFVSYCKAAVPRLFCFWSWTPEVNDNFVIRAPHSPLTMRY